MYCHCYKQALRWMEFLIPVTTVQSVKNNTWSITYLWLFRTDHLSRGAVSTTTHRNRQDSHRSKCSLKGITCRHTRRSRICGSHWRFYVTPWTVRYNLWLTWGSWLFINEELWHRWSTVHCCSISFNTCTRNMWHEWVCVCFSHCKK